MTDHDDDEGKYCILVRNKDWRGSTFHFVFRDGCAYLDVKCNEQDGTDATTTSCSFDGAGCLKLSVDVPSDLANKLLHRVPKQGDSVDISEKDEVAKEIAEFYAGIMDQVPEIWREDFYDNGVCEKPE